MAKALRATEVVTGKVRLSYANLFEPKAPLGGGEAKYSVSLLVPKADKATQAKIKKAISAARAAYENKHKGKRLPADLKTTLHDGDGERPNGEPYGPECAGCLVIQVNSKNPPVVVDRAGNDILEAREVYSGCYGRANIDFYVYDVNGNRGVSAGLLGIQKLAEGEPFGARGSAEAFNDDWDDDCEDELDDLGI